jgi:futalosine hydrolase
MRVIITAATVGEWMPSFLQMKNLYTSESLRLKVHFHQSGIGMLATTFALSKLVWEDKPDLIIQVGIAGTYDTAAKLGKLVIIKDESLGDMGVEEEGKWKDLFDLKLEKSSYPPFERRKLNNPWLNDYNLLKLPEESGITVNEITTSPDRIQQLIKKYNPYAESMEGAALHYVGRQANIPFIQIRGLSNYVGERNKANWKMKESIERLNEGIIQYIDKLYKIA